MATPLGAWARLRPTGRWLPWLYLLAVALLAAWLSQREPITAIDLSLQDRLTQLLPQQEAPSGITLIDIDEASLQAIGAWPWPRPVLAQLAQALRQRGAQLQIWDLTLPQAAPGDASFSQQQQQGDLILGQIPILDPSVQPAPHDGTLVPMPTGLPCSSHPPLNGYIGNATTLAVANAGHIAATPDADGRLRVLPAVICQGSAQYPQLIIAAAQAATPGQAWHVSAGAWPLGPAQWWQRGRWRFALDAQGRLHIPYQRSHNAWPAISAHLLLDPAAKLPSLHGQSVLIGATALGLGDTIATPYHPRAPGLSAHAELLASALGLQAWAHTPARAQPWLALLLAALLGSALLPLVRLQNLWLAPVAILAAPVLIAVAAITTGASLPLVAPTLALMLLALALAITQAQQQRQVAQRLQHHLESFLPPALAQLVVNQVPSGESLGQPCTGAVLGLHIAGLDKWVSAVDSLQALALTHALHGLAQRVAQSHGGHFTHTQGNHLYIAWPDTRPATTCTAWRCAQTLATELAPLLRSNETAHRPLSVYLAMEQGSYLLGLVGSRKSRRLVLLGPVVNEVVAMLTLNAELASAFLVGPHATHALQTAGAPDTPDLRPLGTFLLTDIAQPCLLHRAVI